MKEDVIMLPGLYVKGSIATKQERGIIMKAAIRRNAGLIMISACALSFGSYALAVNGTGSSAENRLENGLRKLEAEYGVTIRPARERESAMTEEEVEEMLKDMEEKLSVGQKALKENNDAYEQYMDSLEASGRIVKN